MTTVIMRMEPSPKAEYFYFQPPGLTIEDLIKSLKRVPYAVWTHGVASVGGCKIPRKWWNRIKVKSDTYLSLSIYPKGGSGDSAKDVIGVVATIAIIATASLISGGVLAPFLGATFAAGSFGATALALGVTVAGSLALSALTPPPIAPNIDNSRASDDRIIAGVQGNPLSRFDYLERVMGTMRASPRHVMLPYTELSHDEVFANAMIGLAGKHQIEDIWINGSSIENYEGVDYETRTGVEGDNSLITLFNGGSAVEQSFNETLSNFNLNDDDGKEFLLFDQDNPSNSIPKYKSIKSKGVADYVDFNLFFPAGLTDNSNNASTMPIAIQMRQVGDVSWINLSEFWFHDFSASGIQKRQRIRLIWDDSVPSNLDFFNRYADKKWAAAAIYEGNETYQWQADSYFDGGVNAHLAKNVDADQDGFLVYLDTTVFPKGEYEFRIKRGLAWAGLTTDYTTYTIGGATNLHHYDTRDTSAPYEADNNQDDRPSVVILESVVTGSEDYPFTEKDLTLIAVKAQNVRISSISAQFTSIVETRDRFVWHFKNDVQGWSEVNGAAASQNGTVLVHDPADASPALLSPEVSFSGDDWKTIRVKAKRTSGASWQGAVYWRTDGATDYSSSKVISVPAGIDSDFVTMEFDMSSLTTSAGHGWEGETITGIELHLISDASSAMEIDFVSIGKADGEDWQDAPTNNPSALYKHVLASNLNSKPLSDESIDDVNLVEFYEKCLDKGYECNYVTQQFSVDQHKQIVTQAGWAVPQQSEKWGVIQEVDRSSDDPVQYFTQRNSAGLNTSKTFSDLPHAIIAEYFDENADGLPGETAVYFPGYNALNSTVFESIRYDGITHFSDVRARAKLDVDQIVYRQNRYSLEANVSHLNCPRGSLVGLSNDSVASFYDSAFITEVLDDGGGNLTGLVLDQVVSFEPHPSDLYQAGDLYALTDLYADSGSTGVAIQCDDGTTITLAIDETENTNQLTFSTPLADPGNISPGYVVAIGPLYNEVKRCIVFSIERVSDLSARLTLIDEAQEIHMQ